MGGPEAAGRRCGVLGDPIAHSLSPTLHRAGYAALGLDWEYDAHRVGPGGLRGLPRRPRRRVARAVADHAAQARGGRRSSTTSPSGPGSPGAANTVLLEGDRRVGDNTDVPGAIAAIRERTGAHLTSAAILGGGATATSVGLALADLGVRVAGAGRPRAGPGRRDPRGPRGHPGRPDVVVGIARRPAPRSRSTSSPPRSRPRPRTTGWSPGAAPRRWSSRCSTTRGRRRWPRRQATACW